METLREKYMAIAQEYARQFGHLIGCEFGYWAEPDPVEHAFFTNGQCYHINEMRLVIDGLDKWQIRYGTREGVCREVLCWYDATKTENDFATLYEWLEGSRRKSHSSPARPEEEDRDGEETY